MEKNNIKIHQKLNLDGVRCPVTAIEAYKAIKGLEIGQIIEIETNALMSPLCIPAMIRNTGHELIQKGTSSRWRIPFFSKKSKKVSN
ncbi:sulfurtransferase TusA family protein [Candidatus Hodarchaeum mangrovi]